jgi:FkbM family methyltransferase
MTSKFDSTIFNNCNPYTNGEQWFYETFIKPTAKVIFDVGCRYDSCFTDFPGEVHFFEPVKNFIIDLLQKPMKCKGYANLFGLSDVSTTLTYYPKHQSFHNRTESGQGDDSKNGFTLKVCRGDDYINNHEIKINQIDFLKIDTEGHEMKVVQGFGNELKKVKVIQFEYGGCYLDSHIKLSDIIHYLKNNGFHKFNYLSSRGLVAIDTDNIDENYQYCNIVCLNNNLK